MRSLPSRVVGLTLFTALSFSATSAFAQDSYDTGDGSDGALLFGGSTTVNIYTTLATSVAAGASSIDVGSAAGFGMDDLVLIHQTKTSGLARGASTPVNLAGVLVGYYELARVTMVAGNTLSLDHGLTNDFIAPGAQVVRVPEYTSVTGISPATIRAGTWNGSSGGIVAFLATGGVAMVTVDASGTGFRGGAQSANHCNGGCSPGNIDIRIPDEPTCATAARRGEGLDVSADGSTSCGTDNLASGGGGGGHINAGGAGGGNGGAGGVGGFAWSSRNPTGGLSGEAVAGRIQTFMTFGGGGGGGQQNNTAAGAGGRGAGIVFVRASSVSAVAFTSNGANGVLGGGGQNDGGGGGGAGGTILVRVTGGLPCAATFTANGGSGSDAASTHGDGSGGGGGRVRLESATGCVGAATAAAGTAPMGWGAVPGSVGIVQSAPLCPGCEIGLDCVGDGFRNPANSCEVCNIDLTQTAYSVLPDATLCNDGDACTSNDVCTAGACAGPDPTCPEDALSCTTVSCSLGVCSTAVNTGCLIGGACVAGGAVDPGNQCQWCDGSGSTTAYSPRPNGDACDDSLFCNTGETCDGAGVCSGGTTLACDDSLSCTANSCNESTDACENPTAVGCVIGSACVAEGASHPTDACLGCVGSANNADWSYLASPTCDSDGDTVPDVIERPGGVDRQTDSDGVPDHLDPDDDGDTIPTRDERIDAMTYGDNVDSDGDVNWLDTDSDGDLIPDSVEGRADVNNNTVPDYLESPAGADAGVNSDASIPVVDSGLSPPDAAIVADTGVNIPDGSLNVPDSSVVADSGSNPQADSGLIGVDSSVATDSSVSVPDGSASIDTGVRDGAMVDASASRDAQTDGSTSTDAALLGDGSRDGAASDAADGSDAREADGSISGNGGIAGGACSVGGRRNASASAWLIALAGLFAWSRSRGKARARGYRA